MKTYIAVFNDHGRHVKKQILADDLNSAMDYALSMQKKRMTFISVVLQP